MLDQGRRDKLRNAGLHAGVKRLLDTGSVPGADIRNAANARLFDHLVGARDERRRQFEPERLDGLEVDGELEFDWLLHR